MPPAHKQTTKKSEAPKPKAAVRAKSGCYTCRIRRKKCDESPNENGECMTCVRLHLECLGFGSKRPPWMRDKRDVAEMREKIKKFLTAEGVMRGTGARNPTQRPTILRLSEEEYYSSSTGPPTREGSVVSIPEESHSTVPISSERDTPLPSFPNPRLAPSSSRTIGHEAPVSSELRSGGFLLSPASWDNPTRHPRPSLRNSASRSTLESEQTDYVKGIVNHIADDDDSEAHTGESKLQGIGTVENTATTPLAV